ncbi:MAG: carboxypeptidase regulatory-like domain-containing protein [Deltaproteobacteria bacterium]|nr:MAG: carboxypeptidase regulatory-like domain-containing protein [Deltaproteobacteria bacterium]
MAPKTPLVLLSLLLATPALASKHYIAGQILDRNGRPVDKVLITLRPDTDKNLDVQLVTDREGRFLVDYLRDEDGERTRLARRTDYEIEFFKPGYHTKTARITYRKRDFVVDTITLVEDTIVVREDDDLVDPEALEQRTHSSGASYEGQ